MARRSGGSAKNKETPRETYRSQRDLRWRQCRQARDTRLTIWSGGRGWEVTCDGDFISSTPCDQMDCDIAVEK